jgi:hypothetical protein
MKNPKQNTENLPMKGEKPGTVPRMQKDKDGESGSQNASNVGGDGGEEDDLEVLEREHMRLRAKYRALKRVMDSDRDDEERAETGGRGARRGGDGKNDKKSDKEDESVDVVHDLTNMLFEMVLGRSNASGVFAGLMADAMDIIDEGRIPSDEYRLKKWAMGPIRAFGNWRDRRESDCDDSVKRAVETQKLLVMLGNAQLTPELERLLSRCCNEGSCAARTGALWCAKCNVSRHEWQERWCRVVGKTKHGSPAYQLGASPADMVAMGVAVGVKGRREFAWRYGGTPRFVAVWSKAGGIGHWEINETSGSWQRRKAKTIFKDDWDELGFGRQPRGRADADGRKADAHSSSQSLDSAGQAERQQNARELRSQANKLLRLEQTIEELQEDKKKTGERLLLLEAGYKVETIFQGGKTIGGKMWRTQRGTGVGASTFITKFYRAYRERKRLHEDRRIEEAKLEVPADWDTMGLAGLPEGAAASSSSNDVKAYKVALAAEKAFDYAASSKVKLNWSVNELRSYVSSRNGALEAPDADVCKSGGTMRYYNRPLMQGRIGRMRDEWNECKRVTRAARRVLVAEASCPAKALMAEGVARVRAVFGKARSERCPQNKGAFEEFESKIVAKVVKRYCSGVVGPARGAPAIGKRSGMSSATDSGKASRVSASKSACSDEDTEGTDDGPEEGTADNDSDREPRWTVSDVGKVGKKRKSKWKKMELAEEESSGAGPSTGGDGGAAAAKKLLKKERQKADKKKPPAEQVSLGYESLDVPRLTEERAAVVEELEGRVRALEKTFSAEMVASEKPRIKANKWLYDLVEKADGLWADGRVCSDGPETAAAIPAQKLYFGGKQQSLRVLKVGFKKAHRIVFAPDGADYVLKVGFKDSKKAANPQAPDGYAVCEMEVEWRRSLLGVPVVPLLKTDAAFVVAQPKAAVILGDKLRAVRDESTYLTACKGVRGCVVALQCCWEATPREGSSDAHADNWGAFKVMGKDFWFLIDPGGYQMKPSRAGACKPTSVIGRSLLSAQGKHGCNTIAHLHPSLVASMRQHSVYPGWKTPAELVKNPKTVEERRGRQAAGVEYVCGAGNVKKKQAANGASVNAAKRQHERGQWDWSGWGKNRRKSARDDQLPVDSTKGASGPMLYVGDSMFSSWHWDEAKNKEGPGLKEWFDGWHEHRSCCWPNAALGTTRGPERRFLESLKSYLAEMPITHVCTDLHTGVAIDLIEAGHTNAEQSARGYLNTVDELNAAGFATLEFDSLTFDDSNPTIVPGPSIIDVNPDETGWNKTQKGHVDACHPSKRGLDRLDEEWRKYARPEHLTLVCIDGYNFSEAKTKGRTYKSCALERLWMLSCETVGQLRDVLEVLIARGNSGLAADDKVKRRPLNQSARLPRPAQHAQRAWDRADGHYGGENRSRRKWNSVPTSEDVNGSAWEEWPSKTWPKLKEWHPKKNQEATTASAEYGCLCLGLEMKGYAACACNPCNWTVQSDPLEDHMACSAQAIASARIRDFASKAQADAEVPLIAAGITVTAARVVVAARRMLRATVQTVYILPGVPYVYDDTINGVSCLVVPDFMTGVYPRQILTGLGTDDLPITQADAVLTQWAGFHLGWGMPMPRDQLPQSMKELLVRQGWLRPSPTEFRQIAVAAGFYPRLHRSAGCDEIDGNDVQERHFLVTANAHGGHVLWMKPARDIADMLVLGRVTGLQRMAGRPGENNVVNHRAAIIHGALIHGVAEEVVANAFDTGQVDAAARRNTDLFRLRNAEAYWESAKVGLDFQSRGGVYDMSAQIRECRTDAALVDSGRTLRMEAIGRSIRQAGEVTRAATVAACGYVGAASALSWFPARTRAERAVALCGGAAAGVVVGWIPGLFMRTRVVQLAGAATQFAGI